MNMNNEQTTFTAGDRVQLHSINSRAELNGAEGTVADFSAETQRYTVRLDSGEGIKIKAKSLRRPAPPASTKRVVHTDPTLFLRDGHFVQPAAPLVSAADKKALGATSLGVERRVGEGTVHTLQLPPAGHWEVQWLEQDERGITVTLVAVERPPTSEADAEGAAWNELRGLTICRTVAIDDGEQDAAAVGVAATVEGGALRLSVPHRREGAAAEADATGVTEDVEMSEPAEEEIASPLKAGATKGRGAAARPTADKENAPAQEGWGEVAGWSLEELAELVAATAPTAPPPTLPPAVAAQ